MSVHIQVAVDDGYTKVLVTGSTTATEVCSSVLKKRRLAKLKEDNAVLCISGNANLVPLDPDTSVLTLYQDARLNGQLVEFVIRPKEEFTADDWDQDKRRERYYSIHTYTKARPASQEVVSDAMIEEYTKRWGGHGDMIGYMYKTGELNTAFKLRFFLLKGHHLFYFGHHNDKSHKKKIDVRHCTVKEKNPKILEFHLISDKRIYRFRALTRQEMLSWVIKLHKQSQISVLENRDFDEVQELCDRIEIMKVEAREKLSRPFYDLRNCLKSDRSREYFFLFLKKRSAEESLLFWIAVQEYKSKSMNESERMLEAANIFDQFLRPGSHHEVAIQGHLRTSVQKHIKIPDPGKKMFDEVSTAVLSMMESTSWPDFLQSSHFQQMIIEHPLGSLDYPDLSQIVTGDVELNTILLNCIDESAPPMSMSNLKFFAIMEMSDEDIKFADSLALSSTQSSELDSPSNSLRKLAKNRLKDVGEYEEMGSP